jgi:3-oxoacyl-[acyl-carrier protein] reductase
MTDDAGMQAGMKVALVTGAGSGLGAAIAARLAADGMHVVVNDVDVEAAEKVAASVGGTASPFDVGDSAAVDAAVDAVVADLGHLDVLVNNAGIIVHRPDVAERSMAATMARMGGSEGPAVAATSTLSDADWERVLRIHLSGTFFCTRAALRHMEPRRSGAIVNMASIAGLAGLPMVPEYSAAKGGIVAFTKSVAAEVAPLGIRVNAVAPAFIDTPLLSDFDETVKQFIVMRTPAGRMGRPEEVANLVRFLASDEASYCVGEVHTVTGGLHG